MLVGVVRNQPQYAYMGLQKYLQQEWDFIQHATQVLGRTFHPAEKSLWEELLLDLFLGEMEHIPEWKIT